MKNKLIVVLICILFVTITILPSAGTVTIRKNTLIEEYNAFQKFSQEGDSDIQSGFVLGEMIIKFREDLEICTSFLSKNVVTTGITSLDMLNEKYGMTFAKKLSKEFQISPLSTIYKFVFSEDTDIISVAKEYSSDFNVIYAEPNYIYHHCAIPTELDGAYNQVYPNIPSYIPNDPYFDNQWALHNTGQTDGIPDADIDAPEAWDIETGDSDVVIAIIDSGVDYTHPDLVDNIWINNDEIPGNGIDDDNNNFVDDIRGWDFYNMDNDPLDDSGHGTHCAGIASATGNNGIGVAGVCWNCTIMPVKGLNYFGGGFADTLAPAICYAADNGANVISMSWGGYDDSQLIHDALDYAYSNGVLLVGAAGNHYGNAVFYPARYDNVIAVAATDDFDYRACFSNYGDLIDVAAPGVDIYSTMPTYDVVMNNFGYEQDYDYVSGTSMACPQVAGLAGLLLSKDHTLDRDTLRIIIYYAVDRVAPNENIGRGRINTYDALQRGAGNATALIHSPLHGADAQEIITIEGSAYGDGFQYYVLDYGRGVRPDSNCWIELTNSTTSVQNDVLAFLDISALDEVVYNLRLKVVCSEGVYKDTIFIIVNNECDTIIVDDDNTIGPWFGTSEHPYRIIRDGVNYMGNGDDVYVHSGTYYEYVNVWKTTSLTGEDRNITTVIYDGDIGEVFQISANRVNINGFTLLTRGLHADGIKVNSDYNTITENTIKDSETSGICLQGASNNIITKNNIQNNYIGILLQYISNDNILSWNLITDGAYGILLSESQNNKVISNNITNSFLTGIRVRTSNNQFYHNNFLNNDKNARDEGTNLWYNTETLSGNYWDDYNGVDMLPPYGIGDVPYIIGPKLFRNRDRYPFMKPVGTSQIVSRSNPQSNSQQTTDPLFLQILQRLLNNR